MSENLSATELSESWDITKGFKKVDGNNLQLAEQIQFSKILRVLVTPPEKVLAEARGPAKPLEMPSEPKNIESERDPASDPLGMVPSDINDFTPREPEEVETASPPPARDRDLDANTDPAHEPRARPVDNGDNTAKAELPAEASYQAVAAVQGDHNAPRDTQRATPAIHQGDHNAPRDTQRATPAIQLTTAAPKSPLPINTQAAVANLSSALINKNFADIAEDLYTASNGKAKAAPIVSSTPSAASALAKSQSSALAQKLGNNAQASIIVTVNEGGAKIRAVPSQNLTPGALFAGTGFDGENGASTASQANGNGTQMAADRQGHGANISKPGTPAWGQGVNQENFANFGQAVRAQAASIGAQQAASAANMGAKVQPVSIDSAQLNPLNGPSGPNQATQLAKAAPPTPPRPMPQARAPMEQIAVNIHKAFGAGADKINIRLNPAALGSVDIKLEIGKNGHISAVITAERPETLDLLQRDARGLERALQEVGLHTDRDSLSFNLRGENQAEAGKNKKTDSHDASSSETDDEGDDAEHHDTTVTNNTSGQGPTADGRIDIRV